MSLRTRTASVAILAAVLASLPQLASPASADVFPGDPTGPITGNDAYVTRVGTTLVVTTPGLLANDMPHPESSGGLAAKRGIEPDHGTLEFVLEDGGFTYTPDPGYRGVDVFYYGVIDSDDQRSRLTPVRITVGDPDLELVAQEKSLKTGSWVDTRPEGVVDGNPVQLEATVTNTSDAARSTAIFVTDANGDAIAGGSFTKTIPAHDKVVLTVPWASTGRSFKTDFQPRVEDYHFSLKVIPDGDSLSRTELDLPVLPRPIIAVHGYKSDAGSSWDSAKFQGLERYAHPKAHLWAVGDGQVVGRMNTGSFGSVFNDLETSTIAQNAAQEATYIDNVRKQTNAWHVDIVAHSMGGLISRYYIQNLMPTTDDGRPMVNRLVQLGTPNEGSACADRILAVAAANGSEPPLMPATLELSTSYVKNTFNHRVTNLRGVPITNEVGELFYMGVICGSNEIGDGVVPRSSAAWNLPETNLYRSYRDHLAMTESASDFRRYAMRVLQLRPGSDADWTVTTRPATGAAGAVASRRTTSATPAPAFYATTVSLGPEEVLTQPIDVPAGSDLGVLVSEASLDAVLIDPAGVVVSTYTHDPKKLYGGVSADEGVQPGAWTLRLTNTAKTPAETAVVASIAGNPVTFGSAGARTGDDGRATITTRLLDGTRPITGARVTARVLGLEGLEQSVVLRPDGRGGYSGLTSRLTAAPGRQVAIKAVLPDGTQRFSTVPIAAAAPPAMTKPVIRSQSHRLSTRVGHRVTARVKAAGALLHYRWEHRLRGRWVVMAGRTRPALAVRPTKVGSQRYRVVVSNRAGAVASRPIVVRARPRR